MAEKIQEIKAKIAEAGIEELDMLIGLYEVDERAGVQKMVEQMKKRKARFYQELDRLEGLKIYEKKYADLGIICGIDEAGRGPLAGPVVAGAVILGEEQILYLNDSKKLSAKVRDALYDEINEKAVSAAVGVVSPERIDQINILQATFEAMREAVDGLGIRPDVYLNDAVTIPEITGRQVNIIQGDAKSVSIAAASIMAKVTRDRMMMAYDEIYPEYGFARHKGYGTKEHIEAIQKYGPSPIHRMSFIKNFL